MKKVVWAALLAIAIISCQPEERGEIGKRYDLSTGIDGSWSVSKVEVVDLTIPGTDKQDLSAYYTMNTPLELQFNTEDSSYTVNNNIPGAPFGDGGVFKFDDPEYPSQLMLMTQDGDTVNLAIGNMVRAIDPSMTLVKPTIGCDNPFAEYNFTFQRN